MDTARVIGREPERVELSALLADARSGRGRAVLVQGPAGVGKTTLAEDVLGAARAAALRVSWGRCADAESPPYWPWAQALRGLGANPPTVTGTVQASWFADFLDALTAALGDRPAVIALEDLHWADPASLSLLSFVLAVLPDLPLLLVLTARDDPGEMPAATAAALAALPPTVRRLSIGGLDPAQSARLAARVAEVELSAAQHEQIHRRTGGNPYFVIEVARLHTARGDADGDVPAGVRAVLTRRFARLPNPTLSLLEASAVLGEPDVANLAVLTGQDPATVREALDFAHLAGLTIQEEGRPRFAHALVRETLQAQTAPARLAALHRAAAERCAGRTPADLAVHWYHAGEPQRAGEHAIAAAERALASGGYEQAVRYLRWALEAGVGDAVVLTRCLGEALVLAGRLGEGRATLHAAAEHALAAGRTEEAARALLATGSGGFEVDLTDRRVATQLDRVAQQLPRQDDPLRAAVDARLALLSTDLAPDDRAARARAAADMAVRVGAGAVEVAALAVVCDALAGPDHVDTRLAAATRMLQLAEQTGDEPSVLLARRLRLVARLERGDLAGVDADIAGYAAVADRLRVAFYRWPVPIWRGMRALLDGDVESAWRHSEEAERIGRQADSLNAEMMVFTLRAAIADARGSHAEMLPWLERIVAVLGEGPGLDILFARMLARAGRHTDARRYLARAMADGLEVLPRDSEWVELLWQFADAAILLGEREPLPAIAAALSPYADLWIVDGIGGACLGTVAALLDRIAGFLADSPMTTAPDRSSGLLQRDGPIWRVEYRGRAATVAHTKGMLDLAQLLAAPGREIHVLDLVEAAGGPPRALADAGIGPVLDAAARAAYTQRVRDLEDDLAEADAGADVARSQRLNDERDFLLAELGAALGLGGRDRIAGDRAERARKAVTMRIAGAIKAIDTAHPDLARHLRAAVSTGRFCRYSPEHPTTWRTGPGQAPPGPS